jgi:ankyrin repeat protein
MLLEKGANPNARDKDGRTRLHLAADEGRVDVVKLLLEYEADPNARGEFGRTPLHVAAQWGNADIVRLLLKYGADPTVKNKDGNTPLDVARREGRHEVVSLIEKWLEEETTVATASQRPPRLAGLPRLCPCEVAKKAQVSQQVVDEVFRALAERG